MKIWSKEGKEERLRSYAEEWSQCQRCPLHEDRQYVVYGQGNPDADLLFIGEAPGDQEDQTGTPFVGESGNLLKAMCHLAGIDWDSLYITNIVACKPPKNRVPNTSERDACLERVHDIIYIVDPLLVVPVGKFALKALAKGRDWSITDNRGVVFSSPHPSVKNSGDRNGVEIDGLVFPRTGDDKKKYNLEYEMIPILHPSFILREDGFDHDKATKFKPGSYGYRTLDDLKHIKRYLDMLRREYATIPKFGS